MVSGNIPMIGTKTKQQILGFLSSNGAKEFSVKDMHETLDIPESTLSKNLDELREAGVLSARKEGKYKYYSMNKAFVPIFKESFSTLKKVNSKLNRKKVKGTALILIMVFFMISFSFNLIGVEAAVPQTLNVQGKLTNTTTGASMTGLYNLTFRIYNQPSGGTSLWTESQNVNTVQGVYDAVLGLTQPLTLDFDTTYYLSIEVNSSGEMTPRVNITSTPHTYRAKMAENLSCTNCVALTSETTGNYVSGLTEGSGINITGTSGEGWSPIIALNQSCSDGQLLKWDNINTVWNCSDDSGAGGEADTLATVTGRGATTSTASSFTSTANPGLTVGNGATGYLKVGGSTISDAAGDLTLNSDSAQTIVSDDLTVSGGDVAISGNRPITLDADTGTMYTKGSNGGWAFGYLVKGYSDTDRGGFGFYGSVDALNYYYIGPAYDSPYMVIDNSPAGNVGIGTTGPVSKLDILQDGDTFTDGLSITRSGANRFAMYLNSSDDTLRMYKSGDRVTITNTGYVGIGTTGPEKALHIGAVGGADSVIGFNSTSYDWSIGVDNSDGGKFKIANTTAGNSLDTNALVTIEKTSGNVGIGTTGPEYKLDVDGDIQFTYGSAIKVNAGYDNLIITGWDSGLSQDFVKIYTAGNGAGNANPKVTILSNDRVGIGTTNPQNTLNVKGTGNFTTDLYVADQQVCRDDGTNCPAGAGSVSPWTNDSSKIYPVDGNLNVTVDTDTLYVDVSNDRVGIGTTGPGAKLDVNGIIRSDTGFRSGEYLSLYLGKYSVDTNSKREYRIPHIPYISVIIRVTAVVSTNSVGTRASTSKIFYLTTYTDPTFIYSQSSYVESRMEGDEIRIGDFYYNSTTDELVLDINSTHNRANALYLEVFGQNADHFGNYTISDNIVATISSAEPVQTPPYTMFEVYNDLTVGGNVDVDGTLYFDAANADGLIDMDSNNIRDIGNLYTDDGTTNFFTQSCTYGIQSIASDGTVTCASQQGSGSMSYWTLTADSGTNQQVDNAETVDIEGGTAISTTVGATNKVTVAVTANSIDDAQVVDNGLDASSLAADSVSDSELDGGFGWTLDTDLNIDSNTLVVSYDDDRVGIGTTGPDDKLDVAAVNYASSQNGGLRISSTGGQWVSRLAIKSNAGGVPRVALDYPTDASGSYAEGLTIAYSTGNVGVNDTSPDASLKIVNDGSGDSFIVADNGDGDSTPFVIQSDGDVGIGTTTPSYQLSSVNSTSSSSAYKIWAGRTASTEGLGIAVDDGGAYIRSVQDETGAEAHFLIFDVSSGASGNHYQAWKINADEKMRLTSAGKLGIGNTGPPSLLSIGDQSFTAGAGQADPSPRLQFDNTYDTSGNTTTNKIILYNASNWLAGIGVSSSDVDFFSGSNFKFYTGHTPTTEGTNRLTILSGGNVGIGTTSPTQKLHVEGDANITGGDLYLGINGSVKGKMTLYSTGAVSPAPYIESGPQGELMVYAPTGWIYLAPDDNGLISVGSYASPTARFNVVNKQTHLYGNVGIGNTGPDTELHIQGGLCVDTDAACSDPGDGNIYAQGSIEAAGDINTTGGDICIEGGTCLSDAGTGTTVWTTTANNQIYNDTTDGVGIGDNNPSTKLSVSAAADQFAIIDSDGSQEWRMTANSNLLYIEDENTGAIPFKIEDGADTDTLLIDDSGQVAIGSTAPNQRLFVNGSANITGTLYADNVSSNSPLQLQTGGTTRIYVDDSGGEVGIGTTGPTSKFQIGTGTVLQQWSGSPYVYIQGVDNEVTTPALLIQDENLGTMLNVSTTGDSTVGQVYIGGNVGIGVTTPGEKLEVAGNINVTTGNDICIEGGTCLSDAGTGTTVWTTTANNQIYNDTTDAVGIGTTSPGEKLHVNGSGDVKLRIETSSIGDNTTIWFRDNAQSYDARIKYLDARLGFFLDNAGGGVDNNEYMTIIQTGQVGINITAPDTTLHVMGKVKTEDGNPRFILESNDANTARRNTDIFGTGGSAQWRFYKENKGTDPTQVYMTIDTAGNVAINGTTLYVDATNGRVGIGTTGPNHLLDVRGVGGFYNSGIDGTLGDALFFGSPNYPTTYRNKIQSSISSVPANSKLIFSLSTGASTYADVLMLRGDGNVGIGTTGPEYTLHLADASPWIQIEDTSPAQKWRLGVTANSLYFHDQTDARTVMAFDGSGKVGIGTTTPQQKLDVVGTGDTYINISDGTNGMILGSNGVIGSKRTDGDLFIGYGGMGAGTATIGFYDGGVTQRAAIDPSGNLQIDGNLNSGGYVRAGGYFYGPTDSWAVLAGDATIYLDIDDDNDGDNSLYIRDGANTIVAEMDESGNFQMDGDLTVSGGGIGVTQTSSYDDNSNVAIWNFSTSGTSSGYTIGRMRIVDSDAWGSGEDDGSVLQLFHSGTVDPLCDDCSVLDIVEDDNDEYAITVRQIEKGTVNFGVKPDGTIKSGTGDVVIQLG